MDGSRAAEEVFLEATVVRTTRRSRGRRGATGPLLQQVQIRVRLPHERIGISRPDPGIVPLPVDQLGPFPRVLLRQQPVHGLLRRKVGIAVIEIAVGECEVHGLIQRVDVPAAVVAHRLKVEVLQDIQGLEHDRPLHPGGELVDLDALVSRHDRLFNMDLPTGQIFQRDERTLFPGSANELSGDVALVEPLVGRVDRLLPAVAPGEGFLLRLYQLPERRCQVRLPEHLTGIGSLPLFAQMWEVDLPRIPPLPDSLLVALDRSRCLCLDGIPFRHLYGRLQHVFEAQAPVLRQHDHQPSGGPGRDGRQRAEPGRILHAFLPEELRSRPSGSDPQGVDADDLPRAGVVDERLGLSSPAQHVPHGGRCAKHGARRVHRIAAFVKHHCAGSGTQGFAGDGHPMTAMQYRLGCALRNCVGGKHENQRQGSQN